MSVVQIRRRLRPRRPDVDDFQFQIRLIQRRLRPASMASALLLRLLLQLLLLLLLVLRLLATATATFGSTPATPATPAVRSILQDSSGLGFWCWGVFQAAVFCFASSATMCSMVCSTLLVGR